METFILRWDFLAAQLDQYLIMENIPPIDSNPTQRLRQGHPFPYTERVTSTPRSVHPSLGRLYSQYGQEAFVWDRYATVIPHTFVEFGCRNGVEHSNTFAFEKIGWKGLCIEAIESIQLRKSVHHGSAIQVWREVR